MAKPNPSSPSTNIANITNPATDIDFKHLDSITVRRLKVREYMRMGYGATQIAFIFADGITVGEGENERTITDVAISERTIRRDIRLIKTELASSEEDQAIKRAVLLDKLNFLYNQAVSNYSLAKGAIKNSFLNTALGVINKIMEIEGVRPPESLNINLNAAAKIARISAEIGKLNDDDKSIILSAIREVSKRSDEDGSEGAGVPDTAPEVRTLPSDDEGVSGEH